ncbi:MAG: alpha/beta hydrolase [Halioglobus sp.]
MWIFIGGMLAVALPAALFLAVKKLDLLQPRADQTIVYSEARGTPLHLHLFRARAGDDDRAPALLLFHGGGWRSGSARQFFGQCEYFSEQGITCISAEYRLGPSHAPDVRGAIDDAAAALAYLHEHAEELGIDRARLAVGGGSSGGHLAASLGAGLHGEDRDRPQTLVLYNPVLDLAPGTASHHWVQEYWQAVSPRQHLTAQFPATLILSGTEDREVPAAMLQAVCATLHAQDVTCELALYDKQGHGFFNPREGETQHFDSTNERVLAFLRQHWQAPSAASR